MQMECLPTGMFGSNCYILGDKGEGIIIDCGVRSTEVIETAKQMGLDIKYILLTHGHIDHICFIDELRSKTGAKVLIHKDDAIFLEDSRYNGSWLVRINKGYNKPDQLLDDGDVIKVGDLSFTIIHVPGHTPGGVCIKMGESLFTGDTLFLVSVGRTDLTGGNHKQLINSINDKLMVLEDNTIVYPGHGPATTIGRERIHNPYI